MSRARTSTGKRWCAEGASLGANCTIVCGQHDRPLWLHRRRRGRDKRCSRLRAGRRQSRARVGLDVPVRREARVRPHCRQREATCAACGARYRADGDAARPRLSVKILTVVGARPQFVKAAVVSRVSAGEAPRGAAAHRPALRRRDVGAVLSRAAHAGAGRRAGRRLGASRRADGADADRHRAGDRRHARRIACWCTATPTRRWPARSRRPSCTCRSRTSRPDFDRSTGAMPEEINRVVTDQLSDLLFCPSQTAAVEPRARGHHQRRARGRRRDGRGRASVCAQPGESASDLLRLMDSMPGQYAVATVHRAENTDDPRAAAKHRERLRSARSSPWRLPAHPRARVTSLQRDGIQLPPNVRLFRPSDTRDAGAGQPRARGAHRFRRPAEGSLLARRAVRDAARRNRMGRDRRRGLEPARRCRCRSPGRNCSRR